MNPMVKLLDVREGSLYPALQALQDAGRLQTLRRGTFFSDDRIDRA
jgi:DNA-binding PadR family transcriptional regulator